MGWLTRFVAIITCRSCTAVDEKVCLHYNLDALSVVFTIQYQIYTELELKLEYFIAQLYPIHWVKGNATLIT